MNARPRRAPRLRRAASSGMTLIEILIALAIAALMTVTGWRAIDALQTARDRIVTDAAQWHALDDFFSTLEADLRRAELDHFDGSAQALALLLAPLEGPIGRERIRYHLVPQADGSQAIVRDNGQHPVALSLVRELQFSYTSDGQRFDTHSRDYPRALRIQLRPLQPGPDAAPVERLLALH